MNMLTIQAKINWFSKDLWVDVYSCKTEEEAKEYIQKKVQMGRPAEEFRIITGFIKCKTKAVFINETEKSAQFIETKKPNKDDNPIINTETGTLPVEIKFIKTHDDTKSTPKRKGYPEEELKLLYFKRSCELTRWAKSTDFFDAEGYPTWTTFNNYLGNISNVKDLVVRELKKDPVPWAYRELIDKHFGKYTSGLKVLEEFKGR